MRSFCQLSPFILIALLGLFSCSSSSSGKQFIATMQPEEPIDGVCNMDKIYVMLPTMDGQKPAEPPMGMDSLRYRVNEELGFLNERPSHDDSGMVNVVINCNGKVVRSEIDGNSKTQSEKLDSQIEELFANSGPWEPAEYHGREVDSNRLLSFVIEEGSFRFE